MSVASAHGASACVQLRRPSIRSCLIALRGTSTLVTINKMTCRCRDGVLAKDVTLLRGVAVLAALLRCCLASWRRTAALAAPTSNQSPECVLSPRLPELQAPQAVGPAPRLRRGLSAGRPRSRILNPTCRPTRPRRSPSRTQNLTQNLTLSRIPSRILSRIPNRIRNRIPSPIQNPMRNPMRAADRTEPPAR